jgi:hypothetical protein
MTMIYNPVLLGDDTLRRHFVVRGDVLERLVDTLRAPRPTHTLIVGPRGMGKTTLLRRLRLAILDDPALRERWIPLAFPEEQYNVGRLDDLWANCVDAAADWLQSIGRARDAEGLDDTLDQGRQHAREVLLDLATAEKKGFVLLIDNLDLVLGRLGESEQWELRRVLGGAAPLVLVGASANLADETAEYGKPFYEFLLPLSLAPLSVADMRALLDALGAETGGDAANAVRAVTEGRLRTLHALTGGNPRTTALLFEVLCQERHADAEALVNGLLDRVTPLYKARFEALPDQLQRVLDAVALAWNPTPAADVATSTGLGINLTSAQLARLVELGHVEKVPLPGTRKTGFQVAERFFGIWYLMRASRRLRRRLGHLVRFMEMLWEPDDRRTIAALYARHGAELGSTLALAQTLGAHDEPAMAAAVNRALAAAQGSAAELRDRLAELIEPDGRGLLVRDVAEFEIWKREIGGILRSRRAELEEAGLQVEEVERLLRVTRSLTGVVATGWETVQELHQAGAAVAIRRHNFTSLAGHHLAQRFFDLAVNPGWSGPDDERGRRAILVVDDDAETRVVLALGATDPRARLAELPEGTARAAGDRAYVRLDAMASACLAVFTPEGKLRRRLLAQAFELKQPSDFRVACAAWVQADEPEELLRCARAWTDAHPDDLEACELLAWLSPDRTDRERAVVRGLQHRPDSPFLLASGLELAVHDGHTLVAGTLAARLPTNVPPVLVRSVAVALPLLGGERGLALAREQLRSLEPGSEAARFPASALAVLGEPDEAVLALGLRGLRGKAREQARQRLLATMEEARRSLQVDAPAEWRLAQLDTLPRPDTSENTSLIIQLHLLAAGGHDAAALDWIASHGLADALAPTVEALRVRIAGDRERLLGLAPELRAPTEDVLAGIEELARDGGFRIEPNAAFNAAWDAERARMEREHPKPTPD